VSDKSPGDGFRPTRAAVQQGGALDRLQEEHVACVGGRIVPPRGVAQSVVEIDRIAPDRRTRRPSDEAANGATGTLGGMAPSPPATLAAKLPQAKLEAAQFQRDRADTAEMRGVHRVDENEERDLLPLSHQLRCHFISEDAGGAPAAEKVRSGRINAANTSHRMRSDLRKVARRRKRSPVRWLRVNAGEGLIRREHLHQRSQPRLHAQPKQRRSRSRRRQGGDARHAGWLAFAEQRGHAFDRGRRQHSRHRQPSAEFAFDSSEQFGECERVSPEIKEIVLHADIRDAEDVLPKASEPSFALARRLDPGA